MKGSVVIFVTIYCIFVIEVEKRPKGAFTQKKQPKFDVIDNLQKVANFASGCLTLFGWPILSK